MLTPPECRHSATVQVALIVSRTIICQRVRVTNADGKTISMGDPENYYVLDDPPFMSASQKKVLNIPIPGCSPGAASLTITRWQQGHLDDFHSVPIHFLAFPVRESIFFWAGMRTI